MRSHAARILLILALFSGIPELLTPEAQAGERIPGMDIAEYQGTIDWDKVGASKIRFIFMRATKGQDYDDPMYAEYSAAATEQNIKWTAYHYALPSGRKKDPIIQANHFVDIANLSSGNILPVLDMEQTGGLGRNRLEDWVARWLNRVHHRTGVRGIIYTSPNFWRTSLGDSKRFSSKGYGLWVAHWGVKDPDVPAGNWSASGWNFWQWSDCGSVPGIEGCVDQDRYNGTHIGRKVTIP